MPSTYTDRSRLEKMATGEKDDTWGATLNTNVIDMIDENVDGYLAKNVAGSSNVTLTTNDGATDETRQRVLKFTGTLTGNIDVSCAAVEKSYVVWNETSGNFELTFKPAGGTGIVIPQGFAGRVFTDGSTMYRAGAWVNPDGGKLTSDEDGSGRNGIPRLKQVQDSQPTWLGTTGGSANAQTASASPSLVNAGVTTGASFDFIAGFTSTATDPTLNIDAFGAITIKGEDGSSLPVGAIEANRMHRVTKNSTNFHLRGIKERAGAETSIGTDGSKTHSGIPANARRIVVTIEGLSLDGTADILMRLGDSGGIHTSGYTFMNAVLDSTGTSRAIDSDRIILCDGAGGGTSLSGVATIDRHGNDSFTYMVSGMMQKRGTDGIDFQVISAVITLDSVLTQIQFLDSASTVFDTGTYAVTIYE